MRSNDVFCYLIVATLAVLSTLGRAENDDEPHTTRPCDTSKLIEQCGKNQRCRQPSSGRQFCECQRDFEFDTHGECVRITSTTASVDVTTMKSEPRSDSGGSSVAAGLLIPTFLIVVGVLLYFGARRYKWLQRFRQYRHNRYGNVIVTRDDDDDDDDPPIA